MQSSPNAHLFIYFFLSIFPLFILFYLLFTLAFFSLFCSFFFLLFFRDFCLGFFMGYWCFLLLSIDDESVYCGRRYGCMCCIGLLCSNAVTFHIYSIYKMIFRIHLCKSEGKKKKKKIHKRFIQWVEKKLIFEVCARFHVSMRVYMHEWHWPCVWNINRYILISVRVCVCVFLDAISNCWLSL